MLGRILVIDDDKTLCEILKIYLTQENFQATIANSGETAREFLQRESFDLILLDVMLPDTDGNQLAQVIRQTSQVPIIFVSARDSEIDKVIGLSVGGDDYMTKPISRIELIARIKAHLRRFQQIQTTRANPSNEAARIMRGPLHMDLQQRRVWIREKEITLTAKEFNLLHTFAVNPGNVLTKEQLFSLVWGDDFFEDNTIMVAIRRLRTKIEEDPESPHLIQTVRGVGYRFNPNP